MTTPPVNPNVPGPQLTTPVAVKTGLSPIMWVVIIVGALFVVGTVAVVGGGLFLVHKVKQAGFDPELMRKNPSLAVTKIITAANPNVEVISVDENKGIIHIRDKQTGKSLTMNFADAKAGRMVFQEDGKDAVTITTTGDGQKSNVAIQTNGKDTATISTTGDGQKSTVVVQADGKNAATITSTGDDKNGTVEIKTGDGGVGTFGTGAAKAPAWMPVYPGSQPEGLVGMSTADATTGSFHFATKDPIDKVTAFYRDKLKAAGLKVGSTTTNEADGSVSGALEAEDDAGRKVLIGLNSENGGTGVTASFTEKK